MTFKTYSLPSFYKTSCIIKNMLMLNQDEKTTEWHNEIYQKKWHSFDYYYKKR